MTRKIIMSGHAFRINLVLLILVSLIVFVQLRSTKTIKAATAPAYSTNLYIGSTDYNTLYNYGKQVGQSVSAGTWPLSSIVIADYGRPAYYGGTFGTRVFAPNGSRPFHSISDLRYALHGFLSGFWDYSPSNAHIRLVIGTNNYPDSSYPADFYGHGQAWAQFYNALNGNTRTTQDLRYSTDIKWEYL